MMAHIPYVLALFHNRRRWLIGDKVICSTRISIEMEWFSCNDIRTMCWYQWNAAILQHDKCQCKYCARPTFLKVKINEKERSEWLKLYVKTVNKVGGETSKKWWNERKQTLLFPETEINNCFILIWHQLRQLVDGTTYPTPVRSFFFTETISSFLVLQLPCFIFVSSTLSRLQVNIVSSV